MGSPPSLKLRWTVSPSKAGLLFRHFDKTQCRQAQDRQDPSTLLSTAEVVEMPVQMVDALAQLVSELEGTGVEAVMLPLVLVWHEGNPRRARRTWPAEMMVERFVEIVKAMASKNSTAVVAKT